jgi:FkbM family methyltransferase
MRSLRSRIEALLLERVLRRPFVFEDGRGLRYVLYPGENARAYIEHRGNYELAETRFCERLLRPGDVAVDVGANIGLYTLLFSALVGPQGRVHTFEPAPENARRLRVNLLLNDVGNVELREAAVFSRSGPVTLNLFEQRLGAWHSLGRPELPDPFAPGKTIAPSDSLEVQALTLDDYAAAAGLDRIALLKIDVEGAEPDVIAGATGLLGRRAVAAILFEVSLPQSASLGHDPTGPFAQLAGLGYESRRIEADGSLGPTVEQAGERYANYVAVPAADDA